MGFTVSHRVRTPIGRLAAAAVALLAVTSGGVAQAEAGDGISASGATVDKVGWWHENNVATSTPVTNVTVPPPPGVPAGTLAVGASNGEPDRLTAIGIQPDAATGDSITDFTLSIKEAGPPASGVNASGAGIIACPITAFWVGTENGTWDTRPSFDCELAQAEGVRTDDGTWSFDLLSIGQAWVDPNGTIAPDGVVLVEAVDTPTSFQTVFATSGDGALVVALSYESRGSQTTVDDFGADLGPDETAFDSPDLGSFDGGSSSFDTPAIGSGGIALGDVPAPGAPGSTATDGTTSPDEPKRPSVIAHTGPNVLGNMPGGVALAIPAFLVLLGLLAYSLGPAGEPLATAHQRGVGRALSGGHPIPIPQETRR